MIPLCSLIHPSGLNSKQSCVGCLTVLVQPTCIVKAHLCAWFQEFSIQLSIYWEMTKCMERSDFSMGSVPKSAFDLMQKLSKCVRHAEEKRRKRKKQRPFGLVECWSKRNREPYSASVCEFQIEQNTKRYSAILRGAIRVKK